MDEVKSKIYEVSKNMPKEVDYQDSIVKLKDAIAALRDENMIPAVKNKLLKSIIDRIVYEFLSHEGKGKVRYCLHIQLRL